MSSNAPLNNHDAEKQADTNTPPSMNLQTLSLQKVECICKAFIRLIKKSGEEKCQDSNQEATKKTN